MCIKSAVAVKLAPARRVEDDPERVVQEWGTRGYSNAKDFLLQINRNNFFKILGSSPYLIINYFLLNVEQIIFYKIFLSLTFYKFLI